jgi:RES domain-containing protein
VRFEGTCYRAHDPRWSFKPLSGDGAAIRGARFNPKGMPALYLALDVMTAIKEANQGFAHKIEPCVLCSYEVACDDIADLRTPEGRAEHHARFEDLACPWFGLLAQGNGFTARAKPGFWCRALLPGLRRTTITSFYGSGAIGRRTACKSSIQAVAFQKINFPGVE